MSMLTHFIVSLLLSGLGVWIVAQIVAGFRLKGGFATAVLVGAAYGVLKFLLQGILVTVSMPLMIVTFGLFVIVINALLLWLTDKLLPQLEIQRPEALVLGTIFLSLFDIALMLIMRTGTLY